MPLAVTPLWLAAPSRFAAFKPQSARIALGLLALLLLATLLALAAPGPPPASHDPAARAEDQADVVLYETIVQGIRGGGDYYSVAAQELRAGGYPMQPFVTFRLPTLAMVQAALPRSLTLLLLYALAAGVLFAWYRRLSGVLKGMAPRVIAVLLVACGGLVFVRTDLVAFHEVWAGLLIALSLAVWREDRWIEAVAIATSAMLIRETAALYAIVMAVCALTAGRRREALGWGIGLAALAMAVAAHAYAWSLVVRPGDPVGPGWEGLLGFGFWVKITAQLTALNALSLWISAPLIGLALFGWVAWRSFTATRALAVCMAYMVLIALFCRADTWYWGLMIAPFVLVGLIFVPDAVRDLIAAASSRRKITITRVMR